MLRRFRRRAVRERCRETGAHLVLGETAALLDRVLNLFPQLRDLPESILEQEQAFAHHLGFVVIAAGRDQDLHEPFIVRVEETSAMAASRRDPSGGIALPRLRQARE